MPGKHAMLSASSCYRWLACPPSAQECANLPDTSSEFARQGTDAHTLCEFKVKTALGQKMEDPTKSLTYFDEEMAECTDEYAQFVMECLAAAKASCKDPLIMIEQQLDFSKWVPGGFGTGDCLIVADDTLTVIDYKNGLGVLVDAEKNPQMMCYALGALNLFDGIYDIHQLPAPPGQRQYLHHEQRKTAPVGRNGVEARRGTGGQRRRGVQGWRPLPFLQNQGDMPQEG